MARTRDLTKIERKGDPDKPLNEQEWKFVQNLATGMPKSAAARLAGYAHAKDVTGDLLRRPHVAKALAVEQAKYAEAADVSRKDVIDGLREAIERAKLAGEPGTEIMGWREIAKICGHYAPEVKKVQLSDDAQRLLKRFEDMDDRQLAELAATRNALPEAIDGEFHRVDD